MDKSRIVIVTQIDDPHTDDVILALQEMGHEPVRLNTDDIPSNIVMSLGFENGDNNWRGSIKVLANGLVIEVDAIRSVWWRRPAEFGLPNDLSEQEREFASDEIDHALQGLWASLDCYWISHPDLIRRASWKGEQLRRAARLGFEVPRTLITTDPDEARAFYDVCDGRMIFKVMSDPFLGGPKAARKHPDLPIEHYESSTTLVTESELTQLDTVRLVPCMFQEYVPKHLELRVTVIGDEIFAAEIHSQADERTSIDWRHYDVDIPYRAAALPVEVAERCLALVRSYGLNFSAIDLILTPDGRYVFVENNPNGQFIFVEKLVPELRMTEALATCLIRGANN
jgi:glutathione synthase/RimK-type ligase-like ATP-grasp enzyme